MKEKILSDNGLRGLLGQRIANESFELVINRLGKLLPGKLRKDVLKDSVLHLAGQVLTEAMLEDEAWRLAGNTYRLRIGRSVPPWDRQVAAEYVPVQIMAVQRTRNFDRPAVEVRMQILAGTSAPLRITKTWSRDFCCSLARRAGFTAPWGPYPFRDPMELVNLRMYVLVMPELCAEGPNFEIIWHDKDEKNIHPSSCVAYNREFIRMRSREDGDYACPRDYPVNRVCHLCHVGQDACLAAVHDKTFKKKDCPRCKKVAWFDPAFPDRRVCVDCHHQMLLRRD